MAGVCKKGHIMFRRRFLKTVLASIGAAFVPTKSKAKQERMVVHPIDPEFMKRICNTVPQVPFLPTLEWLREHNPDIVGVSVAMYDTGRDLHNAFMRGVGPSIGRTWIGYVYKKVDHLQTRDGSVAQLFWRDGKWNVVDELRLGRHGSYSYVKKVEWPDWLRKF